MLDFEYKVLTMIESLLIKLEFIIVKRQLEITKEKLGNDKLLKINAQRIYHFYQVTSREQTMKKFNLTEEQMNEVIDYIE